MKKAQLATEKIKALIISRGFSLVEMLVAISIFLVFLNLVAEITINFGRQARHAINQERATALAEEALEAARNLRDADYINLVDGTYGLASSSSQYILTGANDTIGIYNRSLVISTIDANKKKLAATVAWADKISPANSVVLTTYLTNWRKSAPQAGLTITKTVINHGSSKIAEDFGPFMVGTSTAELGVALPLVTGAYIISETNDTNYLASYSGDCDASGQITITSGDSKNCLIINEEKAVPTVVSPTAANITSSSAVLGANVSWLGVPAEISARGVCYGTVSTPTNCAAQGDMTSGTYIQSVAGLVPGTLYYYRGYATNSTGTGYSADATFITLGGTCATTGITSTSYDNSSSVSALVAKPTGVAQNDIMFAYVLHSNAADSLNSIPTGWIQIGRHKNGNSNQALFYKVAGAVEPSSYTFGLSASSGLAVTISVYRGCFNPSDPIETYSNHEYVTKNTTYRAGSLVLNAPYTTIIIFPSINASGNRTFSAPLTQGGGWTQDFASSNASSQFSRSAFSKMITAVGTTGVIDSLGSSASSAKHAFGVALKPW